MRTGSVSVILRGPPMTLSDVIRGGYFSHVTALINMGLDIDGRDEEGKTAIMLCALIDDQSWALGLARTLIEYGAQLNLTDKFGMCALHLAAMYERESLIDVFLNAADFDPNLTDRLGNTALHYAALSGNPQVTRVLVEYFNKYNIDGCVRNRMGRTPLQEAYRTSHFRCVAELNNLTTATACKHCELSLQESTTESVFSVSRQTLEMRPKTAVTRRPASASSTSTVSSIKTMSSNRSVFSKRPRSSRPNLLSSHLYVERPRSSRQCLPPNDLNLKSERLIRSASATDFRNKREYIFKMTAIPYDEKDLDERPVQTVRRGRSAWPSSQHKVVKQNEVMNWRSEFKQLFHEYEFQCCPSYRNPARRITEETEVSPPADDEEDKDKKKLTRRTSVMSRTSTTSEPPKDRRRMILNQKQRKVSVLQGPGPHSKSSDTAEGKLSSSDASSIAQVWKKTSNKDVSRGDNSSIPAVTETHGVAVDNGRDVNSNRHAVLNHA